MMGYVILLWHSLSLPYNYFDGDQIALKRSNDKENPNAHDHFLLNLSNLPKALLIYFI